MILIFLSWIYVLCTVSCDNNVNIVNNLLKSLFENHNKAILPRRNPSKPIIVSIESYLEDLSSLHESENVLETNMYFHLEWTNEFLTWNLSDYNVTEIYIEYDKVWLPDIFMNNGLDDSKYLPIQDFMVYVTNDGRVNWWPGGNTKTKCKLDVLKYPFDSQVCTIILESWTLSADEQLFQIPKSPKAKELEHFDENAEWRITNLSEITYVDYYFDAYGSAIYEYSIHLKRRSLHHILNIVLPVLLLSVISNCSYLVPPSSGEKMSLCVSIFLSFAVYITVINNELPKTANGIGYFGMYLFTQLFISGIAIILSAVILHIYHDESKHALFELCNNKKPSSDESLKKVSEKGHEIVTIPKNKAFAIQLDKFFFKVVLILNIMSFVVFMVLSKT